MAAENIDDGTAVNLGTMERMRVLDVVKMVLEMTGHRTEIVTCPNMPTGPLNRVADNSLARKLLSKGLKRTIEWYFTTKDQDRVRHILEEGGLIARKVMGEVR